MFNIDEPAPFMVAAILVLAHVGYILAPESFKNFVFEACVLGANKGHIFLEQRPLGNIPTLLTHALLHSGWTHVIMNSVFILVFGIITIRGAKRKDYPLLGRINRGSAVFLGIFILGAIGGGLAQWLYWALSGSSGVALGASTGGTALFASAGWALGGRQRMFAFGVVIVAFDFITIMTGSGNPAWAGHLGGYLAGAALSPLWVKPNSTGMTIFR